jgi:hypothetical protein
VAHSLICASGNPTTQCKRVHANAQRAEGLPQHPRYSSSPAVLPAAYTLPKFKISAVQVGKMINAGEANANAIALAAVPSRRQMASWNVPVPLVSAFKGA